MLPFVHENGNFNGEFHSDMHAFTISIKPIVAKTTKISGPTEATYN